MELPVSLLMRLTRLRMRRILGPQEKEMLEQVFSENNPDKVREVITSMRTIHNLGKLKNRDGAALALGVSLITGTMSNEMNQNMGLMFSTPSQLIQILAQYDAAIGKGPEMQTALLVAIGLSLCTAAGLLAAQAHPDKEIEEISPSRFAAFLAGELEKGDEQWPELCEAFRAMRAASAEQPMSEEQVAELEALFKLETPDA